MIYALIVAAALVIVWPATNRAVEQMKPISVRKPRARRRAKK